MELIPQKVAPGFRGAKTYLNSFADLFDKLAVNGLVPPQAVDVERSILGAMMIDRTSVNRIIEIIGDRTLEDSPFYREQHTHIYRAILGLDDRSEPVDLLSVTNQLRQDGKLDLIGGPSYLVELTSEVVTTANVEAHAKIIVEKHIARELIRICEEIKLRAFVGEEDTFDLLDQAEGSLFRLSETRHRKSFQHMKGLAFEAIEQLDKIHGQASGITGVPSGLRDLDNLTSGWQKSDLIIVAARPSQGKTALSLTFARNAAIVPEKDQRVGVAYFSLEMGAMQLVLRLLCAEAKVDMQRARKGQLNDEEWRKISMAIGKLSEAPIFIDDTAAITPLEVRAKCRRLKSQENIGLVIIDYLQLMGSSRYMESREREISTISRSLKALAKELNVPVIALSQLNRSVETRKQGRPMLSDLRECVTGDTLVSLSSGLRIPIQELVGTTPTVLSMSENKRIEAARAEKVWSVGKKPVYQITLATGRTIKATAKHRLFAADGWKPISELKPGDRVATARQHPAPQEPLMWPSECLVLLGQMIGDGSYLSGQPMRYTTSSEENSDAVANAARFLGAEVKRYPGRKTWHQLLISGNGDRWNPAGVNKWFRELGIFGQRSHEKRVPREVFQLNNDQLGLFLRHLWATDGCIHTRTSGAPCAYYATNSRGLADDVAALLLRLGITARIKSSSKQGYKAGYMVTVTGSRSLRLFLDLVGAFGPRVPQAERLERYLQYVRSNPNVDTLPVEYFDRIKHSMKLRGISQRAMASARGTAYGGASHFQFAPSREMIRSYAAALGDASLESLTDEELFWDRITQIDPIGEHEVFDLTVPGNASWLADAIVSHNSGAIEQDADLVMFIYRPETYGILTDEQGFSTEGQAEIIVGKQRNGPIDDVKVAFVKQYARFEDSTASIPGFEDAPPPMIGGPAF